METIRSAIDRVDLLQPNSYTEAQKVAWLDELDKSVYWRILRKVNLYSEWVDIMTSMTGDTVMHLNTPYVCLADNVTESPADAPDSWDEQTFAGYDSAADGYDEETELLVIDPYGIPLYTNWLLMQISLYNREINHYNNQAALFNNAWSDYAAYIIRTYMPIQVTTHFQL
jgi:hypothetical protein